MKKIIFIALCFISIALSGQTTKWIPFYGPVKFSKQIQIDEVPSLPTSPEAYTIVNYNDTLWIYDGAWNALWPPSSGSFTGDTLDMPGLNDIKLYQDTGGNFVIDIDGHGAYFEVVNDQTMLQVNQVAVDSILVGNIWYNSAKLSAGGSGNDSTTYSGDLGFGQKTAKVAARRLSGDYSVTTLADDNVDAASVTVTAGSGTASVELDVNGSTATLTEDGLALSDSLTVDVEPDRVLVSSANSKVKGVYLPYPVYFPVWDTIFTAATASGSTPPRLSIGDELAGWELSKVEAFPEGAKGDRVASFFVYRVRVSPDVNMTSEAATFDDNATIDPTYKTVQRGDMLYVVWSIGSGTTYPYGANLHLTFIKP